VLLPTRMGPSTAMYRGSSKRLAMSSRDISELAGYLGCG
jgi:hypothetical protein